MHGLGPGSLAREQVKNFKNRIKEEAEFFWGCKRMETSSPLSAILFRTANLNDPLEKEFHSILLEVGKELARLLMEVSLETDPVSARRASTRLAIIGEAYSFVKELWLADHVPNLRSAIESAFGSEALAQLQRAIMLEVQEFWKRQPEPAQLTSSQPSPRMNTEVKLIAPPTADSSRKRRKGAGRKPDVATNMAISSVLSTFGIGWVDQLQDVCEELDKREVPLPRSRKLKAIKCDSWSDWWYEDKNGLVKSLRRRDDGVSKGT